MTTGLSQLGFFNETRLLHYSRGAIILSNTIGTPTITINFFCKTHRLKYLSNRESMTQSKVFITQLSKTLRMKMKTTDQLLKLLKKMIQILCHAKKMKIKYGKLTILSKNQLRKSK